MKVTIPLATFLVVVIALSLSGQRRDVRVPAASATLLRPILGKLAELHRDPECRGVEYAGRCERLFTEYQNGVFGLFDEDAPVVDEALVVLLTFESARGYSREPYPTEALTCEVAERGKRMLRHLTRYQHCNPDIRHEYPAGMWRQDCRQVTEYTKKLIKTGMAPGQCS